MKINKAYNYLIRINPFLFIIIFLILAATITVVFSYFMQGNIQTNDILNIKDKYLQFLLIVFIVPAIETLIFQFSIIELICYIIKRPRNNIYLAAVFSAIAFSLSHSGTYTSIIYTFIIGLLLAFAYYISKNRKQNPILITLSIHSFWNFLGLIYMWIID